MARKLAAVVADPDPGKGAKKALRTALKDRAWAECFVAEVENELAGFVLFCRRFEAHTSRKTLWIADLYVAPEARRIGVGEALFRTVLRRASSLGCSAVTWELARGNEIGARFYKTLGAQFQEDVTAMHLQA
jgi:GNAT superfamily N-acetyltransferase